MNTAVEIARQVRTGERTAGDVVRGHLDRIAELDGTLNAFQVVCGDTALAEAAALDARDDLATLPLAGVPVAVKDNFDVMGQPTRLGSAATSAGPAERDDELVARLRAAGCVVIGKTRLPELAIWGFTVSAAFGPTRNPWNLDLDPGGSTGGGAVAVATGMAALTLGTDGGGSLRIPAAYCGVVGCKPGTGVVPVLGGRAMHWYGLTEAGPIARSVADAAAMLAVLAGGAPAEVAVPDTMRVAMSWKSPSPVARADAHHRGAVEQAGRHLQALGHDVRSADPPYSPYSPMMLSRWTRYWHAGIAQDAQGLTPALLEPRTRTMVAKGRRVQQLGGPRLSTAAAWRRQMIGWLGEYDALLTPTVASAAPAAGSMDGRGYLPTLLKSGAAVPFTPAWNLAGLPAVAVPTGVRDGRPQSVQLVGRPGTEVALLSLAAQLEVFEAPPSG